MGTKMELVLATVPMDSIRILPLGMPLLRIAGMIA